jgi:hypothetical protein
MSSRVRTRTAAAAVSLVTAPFAAVLLLSPAAGAAEGPGSDKGGKVIDKAPEGVELTTTLPSRIDVDNGSGKTELTATVKNGGTEDSGEIRLLVVGFDGMRINDVPGCSAIPEGDLPEGSNSGFACPVDGLPAGDTKSWTVDATYDLSKKGLICLPVQAPDGSKTYWQQGPVPFGTTNPAPNAPVTPLLLGTDNQPVGPGGDAAEGEEELPRTGPADLLVPLGAAGAALMAAGAAGAWWVSRRPQSG